MTRQTPCWVGSRPGFRDLCRPEISCFEKAGAPCGRSLVSPPGTPPTPDAMWPRCRYPPCDKGYIRFCLAIDKSARSVGFRMSFRLLPFVICNRLGGFAPGFPEPPLVRSGYNPNFPGNNSVRVAACLSGQVAFTRVPPSSIIRPPRYNRDNPHIFRKRFRTRRDAEVRRGAARLFSEETR